MSRIAVIGGTGFAGSAIVAEAARRGHQVVAFSRSAPDERIPGVDYREGDALSPGDVAAAVQGADVVVGALAPRGPMAGKVRPVYKSLADLAAASGARLLLLGGFSTLRPEPGAPSFVDAGEVAAPYVAESKEVEAVYHDLQKSPPALDWLYVSPASAFGPWSRIAPRGKYRVGGEVALFDARGDSEIAVEDYALAIVDEIEKPSRHRSIISFAY